MIRSASFVLLALCALTVQGITFVDNCGTLTTRSACYTQSDKCFWTTQGCVLSCNDDSSRPYCDSSSNHRINCTYLEIAECQSDKYHYNCYVSNTTGKCTNPCENIWDQSTCTSNGDCEWTGQQCQAKCSKTSTTNCAVTPYCRLTEEPTPQCIDDCGNIYDGVACNASTGCTWTGNSCTFVYTNKVCTASNTAMTYPYCSNDRSDLYAALMNPSSFCTACGLTPQLVNDPTSGECDCVAEFSCQSPDCIRSSFTQSVEFFAYAQYVGSGCSKNPLPAKSTACYNEVCSITGAYPCADTLFTMCNTTDFFA
eukprot:PhF_6_TR26962/c0_g1_i3/m.39324